MIVYEYPLHENIRTWLRLERLFMRFSELLLRTHPIDHHYAILTLLEIADLCDNINPKLELLTELLRQKSMLEEQLAALPADVDRTYLAEQLDGFQQFFSHFSNSHSKVGQTLEASSILIRDVKSRAVTAGGLFEFDRPFYHAWLHQDATLRQRELAQCFTLSMQPLAEAIQVVLGGIRNTGQEPRQITFYQGQYTQPLPAAVQLLRLYMPADASLIANIKANKLSVNISITQRHADGQTKTPFTDPVMAELVLCS